MLPRLDLGHRETIALVDILQSWLSSKSSIVKTCDMQAFADIATVDGQLRPALLASIQELTAIGTPAMQARGTKLLAQFTGEHCK
jgi:hypothetical protein